MVQVAPGRVYYPAKAFCARIRRRGECPECRPIFAIKEKDAAFAVLAVCAHNEFGNAVSVQISGRSDRPAKACAGALLRSFERVEELPIPTAEDKGLSAADSLAHIVFIAVLSSQPKTSASALPASPWPNAPTIQSVTPS